jgi:hypothetical protein
MQEYLLLIHTEGDHLEKLPKNEQQEHLQRVGTYIGDLMKEGKLKSAQPLEMDGVIVSSTKGKLKDGPFNETKEVIAGYFLITANNLQEAVDIARKNPVFSDKTDARIEVRPIKKLEGIN